MCAQCFNCTIHATSIPDSTIQTSKGNISSHFCHIGAVLYRICVAQNSPSMPITDGDPTSDACILQSHPM